MTDHYTYRITWSAEDQEYVGLCYEFPLLSWLEPTADAAFAGIRRIVADILEDMQTTGETPPKPIVDLDYSEQTAAYIEALRAADITDTYLSGETQETKSPAMVSES